VATASRRQHRSSTGATLALTLVLLSFGAGVTGATLALLTGYSPAAAPVLTNVDLAIAVVLCGLAGALYFAPVGVLLLLAS